MRASRKVGWMGAVVAVFVAGCTSAQRMFPEGSGGSGLTGSGGSSGNGGSGGSAGNGGSGPSGAGGGANSGSGPSGAGAGGSSTSSSGGASSTGASSSSGTVDGGPSPAIAMTVGVDNTACALTANHNIECWSSTAAPTQVVTNAGEWMAVSAGGLPAGLGGYNDFECAVTTAGGVWCWDSNAYGALGNCSPTDSSVPTPVSTLTSGVTTVSAGSYDSACAVTSDGHVWCWGNNFGNLLGNGISPSAASSLCPVELAGFTNSVTAVSVGFNFACALVTGGGVECWGTNSSGQLGNSSTTSSAAPVQVMGLMSGVKLVSVGGGKNAGGYACAIVGGGVQCWGNNGFGESNVPTAVIGLSSEVTAVSVGYGSACAVVNGSVLCWGDNSQGELGNNSTMNSAIPVQVTTLTSGVTAVSVGWTFTCALTASGAVWCWGGAYGSEPSRVQGFPQ